MDSCMVVLVEMTVAMMMATVTTLQLHMWSRLLYCSYKYAYGYFNSYNYCPPRPLPRGAVVAGETHVPVPQVGRDVAVGVRLKVRVTEGLEMEHHTHHANYTCMHIHIT